MEGRSQNGARLSIYRFGCGKASFNSALVQSGEPLVPDFRGLPIDGANTKQELMPRLERLYYLVSSNMREAGSREPTDGQG